MFQHNVCEIDKEQMESQKMVHEIIKIDGDNLRKVSNEEMWTYPGPILLFVGGLIHLMGKDHDVPLCQLLQSTAGRNAGVFFVKDKEEVPWKNKMRDGHLFEKTGVISSYASSLAATLFPLNHISLQNTSAFKAIFSKFNLIGYSYGNALVRQMEKFIQQRFISAGIPFPIICDTLGCLVTTDLGPTYSLRRQDYGMTRLVVAYRNDTLVQYSDKIARKQPGHIVFTPPDEKGACITTSRLGNSLLLISETGSPTVRELIINEITPDVRCVNFELYEEAHSLFMYMNITESFHSAGKQVTSYISLPTAPLIRAFNNEALAATEKSIKTRLPREGAELITAFQSKYLSPSQITRLGKSFEAEDRYFREKVADGMSPVLRKSLRQQHHAL